MKGSVCAERLYSIRFQMTYKNAVSEDITRILSDMRAEPSFGSDPVAPWRIDKKDMTEVHKFWGIFDVLTNLIRDGWPCRNQVWSKIITRRKLRF